MQNTTIISEAKLKAFTDINNTLDVDLIKSAIREAQIIEITRLLGTPLYNKIIDEIDANTLSGVYKTLVDDYIQDVLIYASYYYCLEYIYLRPRNNGLIKPTGGENSIDVDMQLYDKKRQSVKNKMEYFAERLVLHLINYNNLYPEYNSTTKDDIVPDTAVQFKSPMVFRTGTVADIKEMGLKITNSKYDYLPQ